MNTDPSNSPDAFQQELELQIPSDPIYVAAVRKLIEHVAQHRGFDEHAVTAIGLCLNEAVANIIRHAYSCQLQKPIKITVEFASGKTAIGVIRPNAIRISLRDWGGGLHPSQTQPDCPRDPLEPGGLGLLCLNKLMDQVTYTPQADGMLLVLVKRVTV